MNDPWTGYVKPFRIAGNLYFAGTVPASSHIIDTGEGLIMLDSGYPQTLYLVINSIYELGFRPADIKYIVHSHGHYDHLGATRALGELIKSETGRAPLTFIGGEDVPYANGEVDLTWARELGHVYREAFEPDVPLHDGDKIELGNTKIRCIHTPGHTPGTMSYFFDVTEGGKTYRAGMHGGVGINSMQNAFLDRYGLSHDCRRKFIEGLDRLENERVDIFIGNHVGNNDTYGKAKRIAVGAPNPFIVPGEWKLFLDNCRKTVEAEGIE